jgi:Family of unknown function (DUF6174)
MLLLSFKTGSNRVSMSQDDAGLEIDNTSESHKGGGAARRLSPRTTLFVLGSIAFALVSLVLALEFFVVERIPLLTESELIAAKKRWQEHGPASYDMEIELRGAQPGHVQLSVRNRVVAAETRDGRVPKEHTWETWTVPGMFNTLETDMEIAENPEQTIQAAAGTKWQLRCEFDPKLGIPRRYHRLASGGPEVYWRVMRFEAR